MILSHAVVLFIQLAFFLLAAFVRKVWGWLLSFAVSVAAAVMAINGQWEIIFWPPCVVFTIVSIALAFYYGGKGELI